MAETANGRAAAPATCTTVSKTFFPCGSAGHPLFAVREGIPALDALEQVSTFLSAAKDAATFAAMEAEGDEGGVMWTCAYLIEVAKATLDAAVSSMPRKVRQAASEGGETDHE
jgi:DUF3077 family protein